MANYDIVRLTGTSFAGVELLAGLAGEQRDEVAARCTGRRYAAGADIVTADSTDSDVFFIISGSVRVNFISEHGKEVIFRDQGAGEVFGEVSAIDDEPRSAHVEAREETIIAVMAPEQFLATMTDYACVGIATARRLTHLVRALSQRLVMQATEHVRTRVLWEVVSLAETAGVDRAGAATVAPAPTHEEIAKLTGTHREAVARIMSDLAKKGLVQRRDGGIAVLDVEAVRQLSRGG